MKYSFKERKIYCFWFGNEMSENRKRCLGLIKKNSKVEVVLVTQDNLYEFEISNHKIHKGFKYLSDVNKSDYLRGYFMHHYGGGYTDIKQIDYDWNIYFDMLENSSKEFVGYQEKDPLDIVYEPARKHYSELAGSGSFIHKPYSSITNYLVNEQNRMMDERYESLKNNPGTYHPYAKYGGIHDYINKFEDSKYPFTWNELIGYNWHKTQFFNLGKSILKLPYVNIYDYR